MKTKKTDRLHSLLIIPLIIGIIILEIVVRINAISDDYYIYFPIFVLLMLLLIAACLILPYKNKRHRKLSFNKPLLAVWIAMCLCMLYSDIVVFKKYWFLSLALLALFTSIFFIFQQYEMPERDKFWDCFIHGVQIVFIAATIFCFLFRPYTSGVRYAALSANPNVYGMFLITVWACLLSRFDNAIRANKPVFRCALIYAEAGCALFFLYLTGARTSFAAIAAITLIWFFFRLFYSRKSGHPFMRYVLTSIPFMLASFFISYGLLATIPHIINNPVTFERDREFLAESGGACLAATDASQTGAGSGSALNEIEHDVGSAIEHAEEEPSIIKRISMIFKEGESLDTILNGRITIYKNYIKKIDMTGHRRLGRKINGVLVIHAHNNVIQMGYTYGIPAMIFYIILNILTIALSVRHYMRYHDARRNAALPMLITFGFIITSLTESLLMPLNSLLAFAYYLSVGELVNTQKD